MVRFWYQSTKIQPLGQFHPRPQTLPIMLFAHLKIPEFNTHLKRLFPSTERHASGLPSPLSSGVLPLTFLHTKAMLVCVQHTSLA